MADSLQNCTEKCSCAEKTHGGQGCRRQAALSEGLAFINHNTIPGIGLTGSSVGGRGTTQPCSPQAEWRSLTSRDPGFRRVLKPRAQSLGARKILLGILKGQLPPPDLGATRLGGCEDVRCVLGLQLRHRSHPLLPTLSLFLDHSWTSNDITLRELRDHESTHSLPVGETEAQDTDGTSPRPPARLM